MQTAIAFIIYKRPEQTMRVFQAIRAARPARLYIIADGPKTPEDVQKCDDTRKIVDLVDWECTVKKDFSETNLGLRKRVVSGLDWVFEEEETAIILEDDCLPHHSFFQYCEDLLSYYKDDQNILHISGDNFLFGKQASKESYYFSKYAHVWGWATWRRAWVLFHKWDSRNPSLDFNIFQSASEKEFWNEILQEIQTYKMNYSWAYQWSLMCLAYRALNIVPNLNLVSNIGFGEIATNTKDISNLANIQVGEMHFPLIHPGNKIWNNAADEKAAKLFFRAKSDSFLSKLKSIYKGIKPK